MTEGVQGVDVYFSIYTYSDSFKTYVLDETGLHVEGIDFIYIINRYETGVIRTLWHLFSFYMLL